MNQQNEKELLEKLSVLEHEQWCLWAQNILKHESISSSTKKRWEKFFVPYDKLSPKIQNKDRIYAKKSLELFKDHLKKHR